MAGLWGELGHTLRALLHTHALPVITTISNQLSRRVEARADTYSLELTRAPEPFIGFERRIAVRNVSDPDPPAWRTWLRSTHPSTMERIGAAVAFQREKR
jgi:STE24 endopeptidase